MVLYHALQHTATAVWSTFTRLLLVKPDFSDPATITGLELKKNVSLG